MKYSLRYYLRVDRKTKGKNCPLYLKYRINRKFYNIPTGVSIMEENWNKKDEVVTNKNLKELNKLNNSLEELMNDTITLLENFKSKNNRYPDALEIKDLIRRKSKEIRNSHQENLSIKSLFTDYINYKCKEINVTKGTLKIYKSTLNSWLKFEEFKGESYILTSLTQKTMTEYENFLSSINIQFNTIGNYVKNIKSFVNYCRTQKELPVPESFKNVKTKRENIDFITLTTDKVEEMKYQVFLSGYSSNFTHINKVELTPSERNVGRMFVFMCSTGLSFVDCLNLKLMDIDIQTDELTKETICQILVYRQKTKVRKPCNIPILDTTIDMLIEQVSLGALNTELNRKIWDADQRDYKFKLKFLNDFLKSQMKTKSTNKLFKPITNQKFNKILKVVCKKIGFTNNVILHRRVYDQLVPNQVPLFEAISSHTARRTYITLCIEKGIPYDVIQETTGHREIMSLIKYKGRTSQRTFREFAKRVQNTPS